LADIPVETVLGNTSQHSGRIPVTADLELEASDRGHQPGILIHRVHDGSDLHQEQATRRRRLQHPIMCNQIV
jgi:hypothetical protein